MSGKKPGKAGNPGQIQTLQPLPAFSNLGKLKSLGISFPIKRLEDGDYPSQAYNRYHSFLSLLERLNTSQTPFLGLMESQDAPELVSRLTGVTGRHLFAF